MPKYINISKNQLLKLYKEEKRTTKEIAEIFDCQRNTIENKLKKYNIPSNYRYIIPEEELIKLYVDEDKTTYEIAEIYGCHRKYISSRLKKIGISIKRHKRKYSFFYNQSLTNRQKDILEGSLLGDGCIALHHRGKNSCRYIETHGRKQLEYLKWKMKEFDNFIVQDEPYETYHEDTFGKEYLYKFWTFLHEEFNYYRDKWYPNGYKIIPKDIQLNSLKMAIWFFDDGNLSLNKSTLFTLGFDDNSVNIAKKALSRDLNLKSKIQESKWKYKGKLKKGNNIVFNKENTLNLIELIKQYKIPSVEYKLGI